MTCVFDVCLSISLLQTTDPVCEDTGNTASMGPACALYRGLNTLA